MSESNCPEVSGDISGIRDGNSTAIRHFVKENTPWMMAVAFRILRDHSLVEDVVQTAFGKILDGLAGFEGRSKIKTWMHRIVINETLMVVRKRSRLNEDSLDELLPIFDKNKCRIEEPWDTIDTPELLMEKSQTAAKVMEKINLLPDQYRIILILRDIEEFTTTEVAEQLNLSESNVKVRLHRARAALKKLLEPLMRRHVL
ncbi:MAG: sigma-70 family RNA polymerase sigma factor [Hyphomicrobiales bacterium]